MDKILACYYQSRQDQINDILCQTTQAKSSSPIFNNNEIQEVFNHKHLGVTLSSNLTWTAHIINIHEKASKRLNLLKGLKFKE